MANKQISLLSEENEVETKSNKKVTKSTKKTTKAKTTKTKTTKTKTTKTKTSTKKSVKKKKIEPIAFDDYVTKYNNYKNLINLQCDTIEDFFSEISSNTPQHKVDYYIFLIKKSLSVLFMMKSRVASRVSVVNNKELEVIRKAMANIELGTTNELIYIYLANRLEKASLSLVTNLNACKPDIDKTDKYVNRVTRKVNRDTVALKEQRTPTTTITENMSAEDIYPTLRELTIEILGEIQTLCTDIALLKVRPLNVYNNKRCMNSFLSTNRAFVQKTLKDIYED